jgi:hypothetical protein
MSLEAILQWIRLNGLAAFFLGLFLLSVLVTILNFFHGVVKQIVYAIRGVPAQITVSCPCSCHTKKEDDDDETEEDIVED